MKGLSKNRRVVFISFLVLYGLVVFVTCWTFTIDYKKIVGVMLWPTIMLYMTHSILAKGSFDGRKEVDELPKQKLYRRITKYASICLGSPLVILGILVFLFSMIEKDIFSGLWRLSVFVIISVPLYAFPWGIFMIWNRFKKGSE